MGSIETIIASETNLAELFHQAGMKTADGTVVPPIPVKQIVADSRAVTPGSCFVAVRGHRVDGHEFIARAVEAGASVIIAEHGAVVPGGRDVSLIRVTDSRRALARLAAAYFGLTTRAEKRLGVIGVTGTNGKTTVTWLIRSILRAAGRRPALMGTLEYDLVGETHSSLLTTPDGLTLSRHVAEALSNGATDVVLEVSSHALEQRRCDGLGFTVGVFTNLSGDHLDYHGTMEAYAAAKGRLFELLPDDGVAVIHVDDSRAGEIGKRAACRTIGYGIERGDAEVRAAIGRMDRNGCRFEILAKDVRVLVEWPLVGRYNVLNGLAAAATCLSLGVDGDSVRRGLEKIGSIPGRVERVEPPGHPFSVVVDYAHSDDALRNVLGALRPLTAGRLICVFGCGGDRDRSKRPRMAAAIEEFADDAVVTSDNPRSEEPEGIIKDILTGFSQGYLRKVEVEADRAAAIHRAVRLACPGDCVLIAGKGHERHQILGDSVIPFDDAAVAREALGAV